MVTDQEPRYRLVDADGTVVGSLFAESDGTLKLQEGTSGNDNELSLTTQGALEVEQLTVDGTASQIHSDVLEVIETDGSQLSTTVSLQEDSAVQILFKDVQSDGAGQVDLFASGDDSNANYDGTYLGNGSISSITGQDTLKLFDTLDFTYLTGTVYISQVDFSRLGVAGSLGSRRREDVILQGGRTGRTSGNTITLTSDVGIAEGKIIVRRVTSTQ